MKFKSKLILASIFVISNCAYAHDVGPLECENLISGALPQLGYRNTAASSTVLNSGLSIEDEPLLKGKALKSGSCGGIFLGQGVAKAFDARNYDKTSGNFTKVTNGVDDELLTGMGGDSAGGFGRGTYTFFPNGAVYDAAARCMFNHDLNTVFYNQNLTEVRLVQESVSRGQNKISRFEPTQMTNMRPLPGSVSATFDPRLQFPCDSHSPPTFKISYQSCQQLAIDICEDLDEKILDNNGVAIQLNWKCFSRLLTGDVAGTGIAATYTTGQGGGTLGTKVKKTANGYNAAIYAHIYGSAEYAAIGVARRTNGIPAANVNDEMLAQLPAGLPRTADPSGYVPPDSPACTTGEEDRVINGKNIPKNTPVAIDGGPVGGSAVAAKQIFCQYAIFDSTPNGMCMVGSGVWNSPGPGGSPPRNIEIRYQTPAGTASACGQVSFWRGCECTSTCPTIVETLW